MEGLAQEDQLLVTASQAQLGNQVVQTEHLPKSNPSTALAQALILAPERLDLKVLCVSISFVILIFNRERSIKS